MNEEKERQLAAEFAEAAEDADFLSDIEDVESDFVGADAESARKIP